MKLLSICIPTYEMKGFGYIYLRQSFDIFIKQTFKNFDIVISDHSKNDLIKDLCSEYKDRLKISYFRNTEGYGNSSININNAIKKASGKLIKILFLDDFLYSNESLKEIVDNFDLEKDNWMVTACEHTKDGSNFYRPFYPKYNENIYLAKNTISSPSVLTIKNEDSLLFDEKLIWLMDVDYYKRCHDKFGEPKILNKINVVNRIGDHQVTNTIINKSIQEEELSYVKKKYSKIGIKIDNNTKQKITTLNDGLYLYKKSLKQSLGNNKNFKIKISNNNTSKPFIKQLKSFNSVWDNCQFFINEDIKECDLWVSWGGLTTKETVLCPKDGTLLITNEPPSVKRYNKKFLNQFGAVMTCQENIKHPNIIFSQQAFPWWVGDKKSNETEGYFEYFKTYDELKLITKIKKTKIISLISSNKIFTKGHKKRYDFLNKVKKELGDKIDIFGVGFNPIEDKWDAIAPYKYHITIENGPFRDWWTEKLSDAFLGQSYPIYYGCPNIYDYFSKNSLTVIDINKPDEAIEKIKSIIKSNIYEESIKDIEDAKNLILDKYQIFPMLCDYLNTHKPSKEKTIITLKPEKVLTTKFIIKKIIKILLKFFKIKYEKPYTYLKLLLVK